MQAAIMHPPHLVSVVSLVTASDYHDNWTYANGVFDQWFAQSWLSLWAHNDGYLRRLLKSGVPFVEAQQRAKDQRNDTGAKLPEWIKQVPLNNFAALKDSVPFYYEWLAHPTYDQFWSDIDLEKHYADITVPVLMIGGWYDIFSVGTVKNFLGVKSHGGSAAARDQTKLVMAAICHGACNDTVKFGMNLGTFLSLNPEWWDYWLKGIDTGVDRDPAVKLFVMVPPQAGDQDSGYWITANEYPLPGTSHTSFYLESRGHANTRNGDGILTLQKPAVRRADRFIYDPRNPVPTFGGNLCCNGELLDSDAFNPAKIKPGISDQSEIELRDDVLVYTSAPLTKDLTVIGPVSVEFWAASSAPDTDFTAKLVDVRPDGTAYNILDRVINGRLRRGSKSQAQLMTPGRAYQYRLDLGDTAIVFKAGNRIRIDISSSNFPHFARNPNTGRPAAKESELKSAQQTLLHDAKHPSFLELPVVEDSAPDALARK
jgi:putative CocE/NonD family hydrolase